MLFACENDIKVITSLSQVDSLPYEQARDIEVYYSDSGRLKAYLESPLMKSFEQAKAYLEFPEGFKVIFYDSDLNPKSEITAKYGIRYEKTKIMEAKNNVIVKNLETNEQLNTEHLIWDESKRIIYSEVFVKITRAEEVLYGDGLNSDQDFENYTIKNPTGEFKINPDEQ
jgi:LPS export ABC transporter protein LptC